MNRPLRNAIAAVLLAAAIDVAGAQPAPVTAPHAGDAWVDARLVDIDTYAGTYRDAFIDEVVRYRRAPRDLVTELLARPGWTPGDVYFACSLAMQTGRPCRSVVDLRQRDAERDWATIARDLGVAPGTAAYRELKRGIVASYGRWARPVAVDADLARAAHTAETVSQHDAASAKARATARKPVDSGDRSPR